MAATTINTTNIATNKQPTNLVFIKLVPSGRLEGRVLEAAYEIYNCVTRERTSKHFVFYHPAEHAVHEDTFSDYHTAPTETDSRSLLQLCQDKDVAKYKIQDFCQAFSDDLATCFASSTRHLTFVGDHIWQTRSLLYPFMFSYNAWIKLPRRKLVHFVEFRTFMQPFSVLFAQMDAPFELPQWIFRAQQDVHAQVNFFDEIVQVSKRPITMKPLRILKRGQVLEDGELRESRGECNEPTGDIKETNEVRCLGECRVECARECKSDCGGSTDANCSGEPANPCPEHVECSDANCWAGVCANKDCENSSPYCPTPGCSHENGHNSECDNPCEGCDRRADECGGCP